VIDLGVSRRPRGMAKVQLGLSLLEVLVALVITSFAITLLTQALFQAMRTEQRMDEAQFDGAAQALRLTLLRNALSAALPARSGQPEQFVGLAASVWLLTAEAPFTSDRGVTYMNLTLLYREDVGRTELRVSSGGQGAGAGVSNAIPMLDWPGRRGSFKYQDVDGRWHDEWKPDSDGGAPVLPAAVAIETGIPGASVVVAPMLVFPYAPLTSKELEAL